MIGARNAAIKFASGGTAAYHNFSTCGGVDNEMICLSSGRDPSTSLAICMRMPERGPDAGANLFQTHFVGAQGNAPANLLVEAFFRNVDVATRNADHLNLLAAFTNNAGIKGPNDGEWQATSMRAYNLICTPNRCASAREGLERISPYRR